MNAPKIRWNLFGVRPRNEKAVLAHLLKRGFNAELPTQRQLRQWHDRKKWVDMVLIPGYIFVCLDEAHTAIAVIQTMGASNIRQIMMRDKKLSITEAEMERLRAICRYEKPITTTKKRYTTNQKVRIIHGALMGHEGYVVEDHHHSTLHIAIPTLGDYFLKTEVDRRCIETV